MDPGPQQRRPGAMPRRAAGANACLILVALIGTAAVCGGCAGTAARVCPAGADVLFAATDDSLAIDPFLLLDPAAQAARRLLAARRTHDAEQSRSAVERLRLLAAAAQAAPDDPDLWLALARARRAIGDRLHAESALEAAAAAVRRLNDPASPLAARGQDYRFQAALATALARAWHHYDRADWDSADEWARLTLQLEPSWPDGLRVHGLIQARLGQTSRVMEISEALERQDLFNTYGRWIHAVNDESQDRLRGALNYYLMLRPSAERALECYRDMGELAERVSEWSLASQWYVQSAAAGPLADDPCSRRLELPRLEPGADGLPARQVPVWLGLDHLYVTGSLSAYTRYAWEQFSAAQPGPDRDLWAGLAVEAAGIRQRRLPHDPWSLRVRGLVFAATGKADQAREDLRAASDAFAAAGLPADARTEAELGRLLLERQDLPAAGLRLARAVELDPNAAAPWCHLGAVLARKGDESGALAAFTRAVELDPTDPTAWFNRGLLNMQASRMEDAERDLGRAAVLAPDNANIARLLQQVRAAKARAPGAAPKKR